MNVRDHTRQKPPDDRSDSKREATLESLFSHARARQRAPANVEEGIRGTAHAEWQAMTQRRKRRRAGFTFGLAASVLVAVVAGINFIGPQDAVTQSSPVASVERQSGNIFLREAGEPSSASRRLVSNTLFAGQVLSTAQDARLALTWPTGESIRIDENSRISLISATEIGLVDGRIYLDSGATGNSNSTLAIRTPAGLIRHLGTQYLAAMEGLTLSVSVREGRVEVAARDAASYAEPGQQLTVLADGTTSVSGISTYGDMWDWTARVTPEYVLDGRSAHEFIQWASRETGRRASYADASAESLARSTELHGSVDLAPIRALELILQTSDLVPEIRNGTIIIRERRQET